MTFSTHSLCSALLVLHLIGGIASAQPTITPSPVGSTPLHVALAFDGMPMPPRVEASVLEELTQIWAPYGVDVFVASAADPCRDADVRLAVTLTDAPDRSLAQGTLGSIPFFDSEPRPVITMYQQAVDALISHATLAGTREEQWPTALHDLIVGRVLGRGLAHEIGHYLLGARQHSESGLMKVPQRLPDLVAADRQHFGLSTTEQARLSALRSAAPRLSARADRSTAASWR